jgi:hypothetical protein
MGKWYLAIPVLGGVIAFLLLAGAIAFFGLFSTGHQAEAVTFKSILTSAVSCAGVDGKTGNPTDDADNSCTVGLEHNPGVTADVKTMFAIPLANPMHSNYNKVVTFGMPVSWWVALDSDIGNGAYVGTIVARATLSLLNMPCSVPYNLTLTIPLFDCSTDITNTIVWAGDGTNLIADANANGLPDGCDKFPTHALLDPDGPWVDTNGDTMCAPPETGCKPPLQPRGRGFGYTNATPDATPTQINFLLYSPGQLSLMPNPEGSMGDSLGYGTYVILDNPTIGEAAPSSITEFCTPLDTTSTMLGVTAGEGKAIAKVGAQPEFTLMCTGANIGVDNDSDTVVDDGCFVVTDKCRDGIDNDGDTKIDELCDLNRQLNPTVLGVYNTGTHLADTYSDSNRDLDGDGEANSNDGCPCIDAGANGAPDPDANNNGIPDVCDPLSNGFTCPGAADDCDNDGFQNRQDNCPLHANGGALHIDTDGDGIGDACEGTNDALGHAGLWACGATNANVAEGPYVNDLLTSGICIGEADTDGDGWCDSTETLLGSNPNDPIAGPFTTPEYKGIDYKVVSAAGVGAPGEAPQSCTNLTYYGTGLLFGTAVDDNGAGGANAADARCNAPQSYDKTRAEDGCGANTCSDGIDNGPLCNGAGTDGADILDPDCWAVVVDADVDGITNASDNCAGAARGVNANPAQQNTDATGTWPGDGDATGDACDADADQDGADNKSEWGHGTDPKSPDGRSPFDLNADGKVSILDVLLYKPKLEPAHYDYKYDLNLDGKVTILDVLLFKPVLGQIDPDKYVVGVAIAGPGVVVNVPGKDYSTTVTMYTNPVFTATSTDNNASNDTIPVGGSVIHFYCNVPVGMDCGWVSQAGDAQTTRDRFAPSMIRAGVEVNPSAVADQVWGTPSSVKEAGDGVRWIAESALHFLSPVTEPKNTPRDYIRDFGLYCHQQGTLDVEIYNKAMLRIKVGWADPNLWNNEWRAVLHVTCVP